MYKFAASLVVFALFPVASNAAAIRACMPDFECQDIAKVCAKPDKRFSVVTDRICRTEVLSALEEVGGYFNRPLNVNFQPTAFDEGPGDESDTYSKAYLNEVIIGTSPFHQSDRDFIYIVFHEIGHRVQAERYKACPLGTGELPAHVGCMFSLLNGQEDHGTASALSAEGSEYFAMGEGFADFFAFHWLDRISRIKPVNGQYRQGGKPASVVDRLEKFTLEHIGKNENLIAAWLYRESKKKNGYNKIMRAICPGGRTLSALRVNLDYASEGKK